MNKKTHKYKKITENDVVKIIMQTAHDWQGCGIISPSNIVYLLKTSRYQVYKYIKSLKLKGLLEYKSILIGSEDDFFPPYNGYKLSKKGKIKYKEELKEIEELECKLIHNCFGF